MLSELFEGVLELMPALAKSFQSSSLLRGLGKNEPLLAVLPVPTELSESAWKECEVEATEGVVLGNNMAELLLGVVTEEVGAGGNENGV